MAKVFKTFKELALYAIEHGKEILEYWKQSSNHFVVEEPESYSRQEMNRFKEIPATVFVQQRGT